MPKTSLSLLAMSFVGLLTACSGSGDANEEAASRPNSFPGLSNPGDGFSEGRTGDLTNTSGLNANEVKVTVEVPASLAPDGELSRRNLRLTQPDSVRVYRSNEDLAEVASVPVNTRTNDDGFTIIEFLNGQPLGPDVLIEVTVQGTEIRAFATDRDQDIKVNPFSEYIVRSGLGEYSASEFAMVMECVNATEEICINKFVWSTLADQIQDFEIDIPSGTSFEGAVAFLGNRADFKGYVNGMAALALVPPESSGQIDADSLALTSAFFGVELGRSNLASSGDSRPGQWGTRRATEEVIESNGTAVVYPGMTLASLNIFGINGTFISGDVPYERNTLVQFDSDSFESRSPDFWELNSHATTSNPASIENGKNLISGQSLLQTITRKTRPSAIGWTRNPFVRNAYLQDDANDEGDLGGLLSSYFTGGKAIELNGSSGNYERSQQLEEHFVSVFDISLPQSDNFSIATLGNGYNLVSLSLQLGLEDRPFRAESIVGNWNGDDGNYTQTATANELTRSSGGTVALGPVSRTLEGPRLVSNRTSVRNTDNANLGRLNLDVTNPSGNRARPAVGIGASNPDGSLIAFNLSNGDNGEGILIGLERGNNPARAQGTYRMQGTIIDLSFDTNRLRQIIDAPLSINGPQEATVNFAGLDVVQTVSDASLQSPRALQSEEDISMVFVQEGSSVTFTAGNLELTGFAASDAHFMVLQVHDTQASGQQSLGLVIAVRQDE
jgi:hypothetical protein